MAKENFIQKNKLPIAATVLILFITTLSIIPLFIPYDHCFSKQHTSGYFNGINLMLLVIGTLFIAFYLFRQWTICIDHVLKQTEKDAEHLKMIDHQKLLNDDAKERRAIEQKQNGINDFCRLIELCKETTETSESVPTTDKADKLLVRVIKKEVVLDIKKLDQLITHYKSLNN